MSELDRTVKFVSELVPGDVLVYECRGPGACLVNATEHRTVLRRPGRVGTPVYVTPVTAEHQLTIVRFSPHPATAIRTAIVVDEDGHTQPWQAAQSKAVRVLVTVASAPSVTDDEGHERGP